MESKQGTNDENETKNVLLKVSNDRLDYFLDKFLVNLRKDFNDKNETLDKILKIISLTKNEINNSSINKSNNKNDITSNKQSKNENNKLTKDEMIQNLNKLIPTRRYLDSEESLNKVDKFCRLLNDYVNNLSFDFRDLKLSKDDMMNTLVALFTNDKISNRNELFIKLLNIYNKNDDFDINYQTQIGSYSNRKYTLLHWCINKNNLVILNYLLSNFKDRIDFSVKNMDNKTVYEQCTKWGKYNMSSLILESSLGANLTKAIGDNCSFNDELNSISKLFLFYLNKTCNLNELDLIMDKLELTLKDLIVNKKAFSQNLLKAVFDYNIIKNSNKLTINNYDSKSLILDIKNNKLWNIISDKLKLVLNINTLYKEKVDWFWFKNYILKSNVWLYKTDNQNKLLYNELEIIVKQELNKQKQILQSKMKNLIIKNENVWNKICQFEYKNDKYKNKEFHRQDKILNGIASFYSKQELNNINYIINQNKSSQIFSINDYNNYLSKLIILGHKLNKYFKISIENIFKDYLKDKKCNFRCGPVKTLERCITKSQLDYNNEKYPTSAHIIDIIRGSLTFNNLEHYYNAIKLFISTINDKNNCISHYILDILRIKNGFYKAYNNYLETKNNSENEQKLNIENETNNYFIPKKYFDVKINLIIDYNNKSIVGELQLLLIPMLNNKVQNHELYEITRLKDIITHSNKRIKENSTNKLLQTAITDKNKSSIAKIITYNNTNDTSINEIGNDKDKTPLFLTSIRRNSLHGLIFKYFENINYSLCDRRGENILHYVSGHLKEENEVNIGVITKIIKKLIPNHISVFNQKYNFGPKFTPIMKCLNLKNEFVFSLLMNSLSEYNNISIIDFSIVDKNNMNLFHHLFTYCNFNNINIDLIMNRYKIYKKANNINNNNLLFTEGYMYQTIFDCGLFNHSFSLKILIKLELYLNDNNKLYHFIFLHKNGFSNTAFMYLIKSNNQKILLIEYLLKKFKDKIIQNNYKSLNDIKNRDNKTIIDCVKQLDSNNPTLKIFKSQFPKLF